MKAAPSFPLKAYRSGNPADFQSECIELFAEVVYALGLPRSIGQIYGLLYASPAPLSFSDIVERLEISKGSASQGLQLLRSLGAINLADAKRQALSGKREAGFTDAKPYALGFTPNAGDANAPRRVAFEPELGLRRLVSGVLRERVMPLATARADRLTRLRELAEQDGERRDFYLDRVKQLETWRRRLRTVLPVLSVLLGPKSKK